MTAFPGNGRIWLQTVTSTAAVSLCSFLTSVLTARTLGPEGRGLMAAAFLISALSSGVAQMGLANSLVYHCGKGLPIRFRTLTGISVALVILLSVPLSLISLRHLYPAGYEQNTLLIILLGASSAFFSFASTTTQTRADLKMYNTTRTILPMLLAAYMLCSFAAHYTLDYANVIWFQIAVMSALAIYMLTHVWQRLPVDQAPACRPLSDVVDIVNYALKYQGTILLSLVLLNIDKIFLLGKVDPAQFGFYALAFATTRILSSIQDAAAVTTFARYAGKSGQGLESAVAVGFRLTFIPMILVAALVSAISPIVIPLVFGHAFESMAAPFVLLSFEAVLGAASWTLAQRFNAAGRPGMILLRQGIVVFPLMTALLYLPQQDTATYLAALMLGAAVLRLVITMAMIPLVLKEPLPPVFPRWQELKDHAGRLRRSQATVN